MFGILGLISGITGFFKALINYRSVTKISEDIDKVVPVVVKAIPVVGQAVEAVGDVATAAAAMETASSNEAVAYYNSLNKSNDSVFARNVRPAVFLVFVVLLVGRALGLIDLHLPADEIGWYYTITSGFMGYFTGERTLVKVLKMYKTAEVVKAVAKPDDD